MHQCNKVEIGFSVFFVFVNKFCTLPSETPLSSSRNFSNYTVQNFNHDLHIESWEGVLNCHDVNEAYENFSKIFLSICDKHAPIHANGKRERKKSKHWITKGLKK